MTEQQWTDFYAIAKVALGQNIKRLRLKRKITQQQLAEAVGVRRILVTQWESGKVTVRSTALPLIAYRLRTTMDTLLVPVWGLYGRMG